MGRHSAPEGAEEPDVVTVLYHGRHRNEEANAAEAEANYRLFQCAWSLLGDGDGRDWDTNQEYARAIYELVGDFFEFDKTEVPALLKAGRYMNAEGLDWLLRLLQDGRR